MHESKVRAQIDLLLESKAARTDYLCEMKFTGGKYAITKNDEEDFLNKIEAFAASKMHNKTHSIQLVMVTTMGVARGEHASVVLSVRKKEKSERKFGCSEKKS